MVVNQAREYRFYYNFAHSVQKHNKDALNATGIAPIKNKIHACRTSSNPPLPALKMQRRKPYSSSQSHHWHVRNNCGGLKAVKSSAKEWVLPRELAKTKISTLVSSRVFISHCEQMDYNRHTILHKPQRSIAGTPTLLSMTTDEYFPNIEGLSSISRCNIRTAPSTLEN